MVRKQKLEILKDLLKPQRANIILKKYVNMTHSVSVPLAKSTPESSLMKISPVKSLPGEERFTSPTILHNLVHPGKNIKSLIISQ